MRRTSRRSAMTSDVRPGRRACARSSRARPHGRSPSAPRSSWRSRSSNPPTQPRSWPILACTSPDWIASSVRRTICSGTCRSSPWVKTSAVPGRSLAEPSRNSPPARFILTSRAGSSGPRSCRTSRSSRADRWPPAVITARCASKARSTSWPTATSSISGLPRDGRLGPMTVSRGPGIAAPGPCSSLTHPRVLGRCASAASGELRSPPLVHPKQPTGTGAVLILEQRTVTHVQVAPIQEGTRLMIRTVVVCEVQVPFVHGGAEIHVRSVVAQLQARGYDTERVSLPFKWYPKEEILSHAAAWRLLDLSEANGRPIDRVIATKFPAYFVRHPSKVTWLMHQYRAAYELAGTEYSDFAHVEADVALKQQLVALDTQMLGECRRLFAGAANAARRLQKYNGLSAETLYHPPVLADRLRSGPQGDYVLVVGRIESIKR